MSTKAISPLSTWLKQAWAQEAATHAVEVDGATIRYRAWNPAELEKPGLVLVHGFLAHARWWDHIAPHLTDRYRVVALDFSGMGDSDHRQHYSRGQYAKEILAVVRDAEFETATVVAHSFGSSCALRAAQRSPASLDRVILIDGLIFRRSLELQARPAIPSARVYDSFEQARTRYRLTPPGAWPVPEIFDYVARHSVRQMADGRWTWKFDAKTYPAVGLDELKEELVVSVPVDFIHAANSDVVSAEDVVFFQEKLHTCGTPVSLPMTHHHAMIEQPLGLLAALNGLLAHPRN